MRRPCFAGAVLAVLWGCSGATDPVRACTIQLTGGMTRTFSCEGPTPLIAGFRKAAADTSSLAGTVVNGSAGNADPSTTTVSVLFYFEGPPRVGTFSSSPTTRGIVNAYAGTQGWRATTGGGGLLGETPGGSWTLTVTSVDEFESGPNGTTYRVQGHIDATLKAFDTTNPEFEPVPPPARADVIVRIVF